MAAVSHKSGHYPGNASLIVVRLNSRRAGQHGSCGNEPAMRTAPGADNQFGFTANHAFAEEIRIGLACLRIALSLTEARQ
ncbi:MAG TPA: hypothetical protein VG986_21210 [Pseudolabrys sp.]|nr:hypothetical protein [Pseudolabrys sp.]